MSMPRILAVLLSLICLALPSCTTLEELTSLRASAQSERDRLTAQADAIDATLSTLPLSDPSRPTLQAQAADARTRAAAYDADLSRLDAVLSEAQSPSDPIAQAVGVVAPFLPVPVRTPLVLGTALMGTLLRIHQLRQGLTSVARGFEIAKRDDPDFKARFNANTSTFRATQTPLARRIITHAIKGVAA